MRRTLALLAAAAWLSLPDPAGAWELKDLFDTWTPMAADVMDGSGLFTIAPDGLKSEFAPKKSPGHFKILGENRFLFLPDGHEDYPGFCQYSVFSFEKPMLYWMFEKQIKMRKFDNFDGNDISGSWCMMLTFVKPGPNWHGYRSLPK